MDNRLEREMRKTVRIPNLTTRQLMEEYLAKKALSQTEQEVSATMPAMEEQAWTEPTKEAPSDPINPSHYKAGGLEVIQIIEAFQLDYHRASALKYLLRAGRKGDEVEDMKKCAWFVDRRIQVLEGKK